MKIILQILNQSLH